MGAYKFGFQKEWYHYSRTFRFGGVIIALISVAIANPLMLNALMSLADSLTGMSGGMIGYSPAEIEELSMVYTAKMSFGAALADLCNTALLVILLLFMSPFGGEQKKRATLIPSCSGLDNRYYLVPKFVLYSATVFAVTVVAGIIAGLISNSLFTEPVSFGYIITGSLLCAVYLTFILSIYMALGLSTSRPGIMVIVVYFGQSLVQSILLALDMSRYNPFTLYNVFAYQMAEQDFSFKAEAASIIVGVVLSVVISVMMYFLTLAVLKTKRINNQDNKPEF